MFVNACCVLVFFVWFCVYVYMCSILQTAFLISDESLGMCWVLRIFSIENRFILSSCIVIFEAIEMEKTQLIYIQAPKRLSRCLIMSVDKEGIAESNARAD